ncbi:MAG: hypothetical protein H8D45_20605 [Bacteroidetes bacterium]|nr:hypothetical protein [Bacteroidota bacterium]MBL7103400.1 hypothetical protein [Bacteroidales bacterium]
MQTKEKNGRKTKRYFFTNSSINKFGDIIKQYYPEFDKEKFLNLIFKITENTYNPGNYPFSRKHSFADMSTRKHFEGEHRITIIVNGEEMANKSFEVKR